MNGINHFFCKLLLFVILLYQVISYIAPETASLSRMLSYIWAFICLYYMVKVIVDGNNSRNNKFSLLLFIFWLVNTFSFIISPKTVYDVNTIEVYKSATIALLSFFPFYYFVRNGILDENKMSRFTFLLFLLFIVRFFFSRTINVSEQGDTDVVLNESYNFILLIPYVLLFAKGRKLILMLASIVCFVLLGAKRGAIVSLLLSVVIMLHYYLKKDAWGTRHKFLIWTGLFFIAAIAFYLLSSSDFALQRLLSTGSIDDASGDVRRSVYTILYASLSDNSIKEWLFGRGMVQTVSYATKLAHQDWIEILFDYGVVGMIPYIAMFIYGLFDLSKNMSQVSTLTKYCFFCCIMTWMVKASISMVFYSRKCFLIFAFIGICQGIKDVTKDCIIQRPQ